jgi:hypothetical protein
VTALTVRDVDVPDLLGTAPADLIDRGAEQRPASADTARQRAERIRADLKSYTRMRQDIADAYACRDWAALGYESWFAYLEGEFGEQLQQLARDREQRPAAVRDLRTQGLSTRQIGAVTGVDPKTVRNDLDAAGQVGTDSPPDGKVIGSDGKSYPARRAAKTGGALPVDALVQWLTTTVSPPDQFERATGAMRYPERSLDLTAADVAGVLNLPEPAPGPVAGVVLHTGSRRALTVGPFATTAAACAWWAAPFNKCAKNDAFAFVPLPLPDAADSPAGPAAALTTPGDDGGDSRLQDRPGADPSPPAPSVAPAEAERPIVLVASPVSGQPAVRAELWEDKGGPTVKVVYCDSRTGAWVARRRIAQVDDDPAPAVLPDRAEDFGTVTAAGRDLHVRGGWHANTDLRVALLAVENDGQETELLALNALKVELLISRLQAVHRWLVTA